MSDEKAAGAISALDKLYEFEREPVSKDKLHSWRHFAALLAGEHVAGTEFVIGAMFVQWGVRTYDVIVGLLIGNLLAVLTWALVCAPIAVRTRLTLYWYLRKVAGPGTTLVYNILNAGLYCILAGCMITVSASAVRMLFGIPPQTLWYPQDVRWIILVLVLGAVVVALAILGFKKLAQFAEVCSPWMFLMFLAGGLVMIPALAAKVGAGEVTSWSAFWNLGDKYIWTGQAPQGKTPMSFWQVAAFAWICNLAMHGGLSDMALFRYAKTASCGLTSAFGMFFGHYLAWIFAGIMGAATAALAIQGAVTPQSINDTMLGLDAGTIAAQALGIAGAIAVILAGWTTSNPTLYRAGLAFQAVTPGWPRWRVTLVAGIATTVVACFPFVFTELLGFVGWYGLLLMPVGAIVFWEHWIFPKLGFTQYWCARKKLLLSWPALLSWGIGITVSILVVRFQVIHNLFKIGRADGDIFFMFVPIWLLTGILYTIFAAFAGAREKLPELVEAPVPVRPTEAPAAEAAPSPGGNALLYGSGVIALASLAVCLIMPIWVFLTPLDQVDSRLDLFKKVVLAASLVYFMTGTVYAVQKDKRKGGF